MNLTYITGLPTELDAGETARIHFTKAGKMIRMAYPMSISLSALGRQDVRETVADYVPPQMTSRYELVYNY